MNKRRTHVEAGTVVGPLTAVQRVADYVTPSTGQISERWRWRCRCGASVVLRVSDARYRASLNIGCRSASCDLEKAPPPKTSRRRRLKPEKTPERPKRPWWWWKWVRAKSSSKAKEEPT